MADDQARLSDALKKSLETFKDKSLEVYAYSTTQLSYLSVDKQTDLLIDSVNTTNISHSRVGSYAGAGGTGMNRFRQI